VFGVTRRSLLAVGAAFSLAAPAVLLATGAAPASADGGPATAAAAVAGWRPQLTPLGRATPAATPSLTPAAAGSPWKALRNAPPFIPGTMLLGSDGTVYVHSEPETGGTADWWRLTPGAKGGYVNGTWSQMPSMPGGYDPLYFSSAILPDGRMIVEGGEYLGGTPTWTNKGAIYNPVTNHWTAVAPPSGWTNIGDAMGDVLANGTYMLSQACQNCTSANPQQSTSLALFNATGLNWLTLGGQGKNDPNDEEGWTLQPNGQLLTIDTWLTPTTELFTPSSLSWSFAGNTVKSPVNTPSAEIGPQAEVPNGNTFVVGAGTGPEAPDACTTATPAATAVYDNATASWQNGPAIPVTDGQQYDSADGPAATLPDGDVLFDASPCVYNAPIVFYEYDPTSNALTAVPDIANASQDSTYYTRMVNLPNGQVLFNDGSSKMEVFTGGGTPNPAWAPSISSVSEATVRPGQQASLSGSQLAGLDQGSVYGDDAQQATNFPIVRITNSATGTVTYARTSNWTSVSVAPGAPASTQFTVPSTAPAGAGQLQVIANGIASAPVPITIR
jgi:hypothetical protein